MVLSLCVKDNGGVRRRVAGKHLDWVRGLFNADEASFCICLADAFGALAGFWVVLFGVRSLPVSWAVGLGWCVER